MKLPKCIYADDSQNCNVQVQFVYEQLRTLTEKRIDGYNLSDSLPGDGLEWEDRVDGTVAPRKLINSLAITSNSSYIRRKSSYGIEIIVDTSNTTSGRFCIVDKDYLDQQLISCDPEDPATNSNPGGEIQTPYGAMTISTGIDSNIIFRRNKTTKLTITDTNVIPNVTNDYDLGSSTVGWREIYSRIIDTDGANNLILQRNNVTKLTLGNTQTSSTQHIIPGDTNSYDLGGDSAIWREIWVNSVDTGDAVDLVLQRNNVTKLTLGNTQTSSTQQIVWSDGIGAITHLLGPTDQIYSLASGSVGGNNTGLNIILTAGNASAISGNTSVTGGSVIITPGTGARFGALPNANGGDVRLDSGTAIAAGKRGLVNFNYLGVAADTNVPTFINTPTGVVAAQIEWLEIKVNGNVRYIPVWG